MAQFSRANRLATLGVRALLFSMLGIGSMNTQAQAPTIVYSAQVYGRGNAESQPSGGDANLGKSSTAVDAAGNIYVTGSTSNGLNIDYLTVKYSPAGAIVWRTVTNGGANGNDIAKAIAVDSSGDVLVTGSSEYAGQTDYLTVKYSGSNGAELWRATFNGVGNGDDDAYAIAVDAANNVVVTGTSFVSPIRTNFDYVTVKYNAAGAEQWRMSLDGGTSSTDRVVALCLDSAGNPHVTGYSLNFTTFNYDYVTVKYPAVGFTNIPFESWRQTRLAPSTNDFAFAMACDASNNVYVTGQSFDGTSGTAQFLTVKYRSDGFPLWNQNVTTPATPPKVTRSAYAIALDPTGNVFVTGSEWNKDNNISVTNPLHLTIKYDSSGVEQWRSTLNGAGTGGAEIYTALATDGAGNVYASGFANNAGNNELIVVKYSPAGGVLWQSFVPGAGSANSAALMALRVDAGGNVIATGYRHNGFENDFLVVKFDGAGNWQWSMSEGENAVLASTLAANADGRNALALDGAGNVYVAGQSGLASNGDFITAKIDVSGNTQWRAVLNGASGGIDRAYTVAVDGGGNVYASGDSNTGAYSDFMTVKYDANGIEQWRRQPGHAANTSNSVRAMVADPAGGVIVTGHASAGGDYLTIKYAADGTELWKRTVNGIATSVDTPVAMARDSSGNIIITGRSFDGAVDRYLTVKYSSTDNSTGGAPQWSAVLNSNTNSPRQPFAMATDAANNIYITGDTTVKYDTNGGEQWQVTDSFRAFAMSVASDGSVVVGGSNGNIVKYDINGGQVWRRAINGSVDSRDTVYALAMDIDGSIYATGRNSDDSSGNYLTVKLDANGTERWRVTTYTNGGGLNGTPALVLDAGRKLILAGNAVSGIEPSAILVTKFSQSPEAPTGVTAAAGNGSALVTFTLPPPAASQITSYTITCQPGAITMTVTSSPALLTGLANGQAYACNVVATNSFGNGPPSATVNVTPSSMPALALFAVKSKKTHGAAGDFSIDIVFPPVVGLGVTVEPRAISTGHKIIFQFNDTVNSIGTVSATDANSMPIGSVTPVIAGNDVMVTLTGVPDNQRVQIGFLATGPNGSTNAIASLGFLVGDVSNTRVVSAADISSVKAHLGQTVSAANFRFDLDISGSIGAADLSAAKARSAMVLP